MGSHILRVHIMGMSIKGFVVLAVLVGGGIWAWNHFKVGDNLDINPYTAADAYFTPGVYDKALEAYRKAIADQPHHEDVSVARFRIAICLQKLERHPEALRAYQAFLKQYPQHELAGRAGKFIQKYELEGVKPAD